MRNNHILIWSSDANVFESVAMNTWVILLGDIKRLNKNIFKYQRLWLKKQHLPRGENCTITYNVPGCLPVENQVMENVHIQHREKAKPHSYIRSPIALSLFIYKNIFFFVHNTRKFCRQSLSVCVLFVCAATYKRASIYAWSFPLCWLKWVRIN